MLFLFQAAISSCWNLVENILFELAMAENLRFAVGMLMISITILVI